VGGRTQNVVNGAERKSRKKTSRRSQGPKKTSKKKGGRLEGKINGRKENNASPTFMKTSSKDRDAKQNPVESAGKKVQKGLRKKGAF